MLKNFLFIDSEQCPEEGADRTISLAPTTKTGHILLTKGFNMGIPSLASTVMIIALY